MNCLLISGMTKSGNVPRNQNLSECHKNEDHRTAATALRKLNVYYLLNIYLKIHTFKMVTEKLIHFVFELTVNTIIPCLRQCNIYDKHTNKESYIILLSKFIV